MIISDRHLGIKAAMEKVYPNIPHEYYVFQMAQNIKNDYKRKDVSFFFFFWFIPSGFRVGRIHHTVQSAQTIPRLIRTRTGSAH